MYLKKLLYLGAFLATILVAAGLVFYQYTSAAVVAKPGRDWPSFTMTFKAWAVDYGPNLTPGYAVYKLEYNGVTNWRLENLEYPGKEDAVGTWTAYDGKTLRSYDASFKRLSEAPAPGYGHYVPADWLVPGKIEHLKRQTAWKQSIDELGNTVLSHTEVLLNEQGQKDTKVTQITVDRATGIPVRVIDQVNGRVAREISVLTMTTK